MHHCFYIITANVNTMKKENDGLILLWQVLGLHRPYGNVSGTPRAHAGLSQGISNSRILKEYGKLKKKKKYLCSGLEPDQLNQNHWEWGLGISMFFLSFQVVSTISKAEKCASGLSGIWTCFEIYVPSSLFHYSDFSQVLMC